MNLIGAAVSRALNQSGIQAPVIHERAAPARARSFDAALALTTAFNAGDYSRAWQLLEDNPTTRIAGLPVPRWNGQNFSGVMAVFPDDGLGDQIMLARFIRRIKSRGVGPVVVLAPKPLARLFSRIQGVDDVFPIDRVPGGHTKVDLPWRPDWYVNITSLPRIFECRLDSVPAAPYIIAAPSDIKYWRPKLPQTDGLRVGLVWRGDSSNAKDAWRSLPRLASLAPLWRVPGVNFVSLQVGCGEDEARSSPLPLTHLGSDVRDFADTAAILAQLDLLVSVDTSTANLAGAMGMPTWVLLEHSPDFRWGHRWYPTARVFHQHRPGEWGRAIDDVAMALGAAAQSRRRQGGSP